LYARSHADRVPDHHIYTHIRIQDRRVATFRNLKTMEETTKKFDAMHVTPYMSPPDAIKNSPLADKTGFIDINKETLQHTKYPNVFALGPCSLIFKARSAMILSPACPL
jgi:sulfide:quinone oxidoreductase